VSGGLVALLDDVAAIARIAAASIDDVGIAAGKAGMKALGVVVDDTAVTPRYVTGFRPERELPIIFRIASGSLKNKLLFILPAALLLSQFLPWAITPLLMLGGAYLCYEGAEKLWEAVSGHKHDLPEDVSKLNSVEHEEEMVRGAIRTDFILSAEIMAIALAEVADQAFLMRAVTLVAVAFMITLAVYGVVSLIVKMDDVGLRLANSGVGAARSVGRGLVKFMPVLLAALSVVGTVAMLWVGGHIILEGLATFGWKQPAHLLHDAAEAVAHAVPWGSGLLKWIVETIGSGLVGVLIGGIIVAALHGRTAKH